jgi:hypothetical protein
MVRLEESIEVYFGSTPCTGKVVDLIAYGVVIEASPQLLNKLERETNSLQVGTPALIKIPASWAPFYEESSETRPAYLASTRRLHRALFHCVLCFNKLSAEEQRDFRALIRRLK